MIDLIRYRKQLLGRPVGKKKRKATSTYVLLYGFIEAHAKGPKGCIVSNQTLADEVGCSIQTIKNMLCEIADAGWIAIEYTNSSKTSRGRIIPLVSDANVNGGCTQGSTVVYSREYTVYSREYGGVLKGVPEGTVESTERLCDAPYGRSHAEAAFSENATDGRGDESAGATPPARSDPKRASVPPEFEIALEIERLLQSPQKHMRLVGAFVNERYNRYGMDVQDQNRFRVIVDRQVKAAAKIISSKVRRVDVMYAMDRAFGRCGDEATLDTVYKYLAK